MRASDICLGPEGGVTGDTVLNMMRGIREEKDKKAEITEKNFATRVKTKADDISKYMTLWKATVDKLNAVEWRLWRSSPSQGW